ncbi:MAG: hypothetical protein WBP93_06045 [Pyrinomonadaceae bacterium]
MDERFFLPFTIHHLPFTIRYHIDLIFKYRRMSWSEVSNPAATSNKVAPPTMYQTFT